MAVEVTAGGTMITGEHIEVYRILAVASALAIEVKFPGMSNSRRSIMLLANSISGSSKRTKKGALKDLIKFMEANDLPVGPRVRAAVA